MIRSFLFILLMFMTLNVPAAYAQESGLMADDAALPVLPESEIMPIEDVPVPDENALDSVDEAMDEGADMSTETEEAQSQDEPSVSEKETFNPSDYPSILLTNQEYLAIMDARNSRGLVRPTTEAEEIIDGNNMDDELSLPMPPPEERYIRLGGILYKSPKTWTVWLNGARVTPDALPLEVIDFHVEKDYIEMKWFDEYTRQILPIRLRANQRFHIDTRMFLPG